MSNSIASTDRLNTECHVFCKYLINQEPNDYVLEKYRAAHSVADFRVDGFDRLLINIATMHPFFTKLADAYARMRRQNSALRRKLILLLAMLESCSPTYRYLDSTDGHTRAGFYIRLALRGFAFVFILLVSLIFLTPLHFVFTLKAGFTHG